MAKKVYVGLSGGVDSSVTAALLKEQGYDVTGVYMKNWSQDLPGFECPWKQDFTDAKRVAVQLGIPFRMYDFEKDYRQKVVDYMIDGYRAGRTPNPDIMCNQEIKFKLFLETALADGADMVATGHYARVEDGKLLKAKDDNKDQTYFLYRVSEDALRRTLFPLGGLTKPQVRELARKFGLATATKKESMGICFVGKVGIKEFLTHELGEQVPGNIIDQNGTVLGRHDGAIYYTIGQRHGLGVGAGLPYYVVGKDMDKNEVYVTTQLDDERLWNKTLNLTEVHWINGEPRVEGDRPKGLNDLQSEKSASLRNINPNGEVDLRVNSKAPSAFSGFRVQVRTRHRAPLVDGTLQVASNETNNGTNTLLVALSSEIRAMTPGQSAVLYDGEIVLGGGIIV